MTKANPPAPLSSITNRYIARVATIYNSRASTHSFSHTKIAASSDKLPFSKIGTELCLKTAYFLDRATEHGFLALEGDRHVLTVTEPTTWHKLQKLSSRQTA